MESYMEIFEFVNMSNGSQLTFNANNTITNINWKHKLQIFLKKKCYKNKNSNVFTIQCCIFLFSCTMYNAIMLFGDIDYN